MNSTLRHVQNDLDTVTRLLATHATNVSAAVAQNRYDLNIISESVLKPMFRIIFDLPNIENLNELETNYQAIDLCDFSKRVCIQVTSTAKADKIKKTIKQFNKKELYKKFDRLIIYMITSKQKAYAETAIKKEVNNKFDFNIKRDIQDYTDVSKLISNFQVDKIRTLSNVLSANFSGGKFPVSTLDIKTDSESLYLNWVPVVVPTKLFSASTTLNPLQIKAHLRTSLVRSHDAWYFNNKTIFTFSDLSDNQNPFSLVIDEGTVEQHESHDFFQIDVSYMNIFKNLLKVSLQNMLAPHNVFWQKEANLFIFGANDQEADSRTEHWKGKVNTKRQVYWHFRKKDDPQKTLQHRHLAFKIDFTFVENKWFMTIKPEWFISYDGYRRNHYGSDSLKYLKKKERNRNVFNHTRFIAYFLQQLPNEKSKEKNLLNFGDLVEIGPISKFIEPSWKEEIDDNDLEIDELTTNET